MCGERRELKSFVFKLDPNFLLSGRVLGPWVRGYVSRVPGGEGYFAVWKQLPPFHKVLGVPWHEYPTLGLPGSRCAGQASRH